MHDWSEVTKRATGGNAPPDRRIEKSEAEWRAQLSPDVFSIARHAATERPFSSEMCGLFEPGIYACACCGSDRSSKSGGHDRRICSCRSVCVEAVG